MILIYNHEFAAGVNHLKHFLRNNIGIDIVANVDGSELIHHIKNNSKNIEYIFLPGAKKVGYGDDLLEHKNLIQDYVKNGGKLWGICGGGYLASEKYIFQEQESEGLGIFNGKAVGDLPELVYGKKYPEEESGRFISIIFNQGNNSKQLKSVWYKGGPKFIDFEKNDTSKILARYMSTKEISAVKQEIGKGSVVVTGFHPERFDFEEGTDDSTFMKGSKEFVVEFMQDIIFQNKR